MATTPADKLSLWRRYAASGNPKDRDRLIEEYAPLARRVVDRLQIVPWGCVSYDDLTNHALIGLINCVDRYTP